MTFEWTTTNTEQLLALLEQQRGLYSRLQDLSMRQRGLISGERPELLLELLRERQTLVLSLAQLNQALSPFRQDWDERFGSLPDGVRQRAAGLLESINVMLEKILASDQEDGALLAARKRVVAQNLNQLVGTTAAHSAYSRKVGSTSAAQSADMTG